MIRISGSAATIYPILAAEMSFDGDSVSHYYSAVSGSLPALRALTRGFPSALVGYSGGVDSALLAVVLRQDLGEHRPGYAAGVAAGVRSPLADVGFTKADVRRAARALGLPIWDAPAAPCLSSRVAYGIAITPGRLAQVEQGEAYLRELGVTGDLRVRHHGERARIEVEPRWIPWLAERLPAIERRLGELGFAAVELDPLGYRRGSLLASPRRAAGA